MLFSVVSQALNIVYFVHRKPRLVVKQTMLQAKIDAKLQMIIVQFAAEKKRFRACYLLIIG